MCICMYTQSIFFVQHYHVSSTITVLYIHMCMTLSPLARPRSNSQRQQKSPGVMISVEENWWTLRILLM